MFGESICNPRQEIKIHLKMSKSCLHCVKKISKTQQQTKTQSMVKGSQNLHRSLSKLKRRNTFSPFDPAGPGCPGLPMAPCTIQYQFVLLRKHHKTAICIVP